MNDWSGGVTNPARAIAEAIKFRTEIRAVIRRMLKVESTPIGTVRMNFEEVFAELRKRGLIRTHGGMKR